MISTILNIILFVVILGILVFVHELGHFLTAKKSGVHIYEFSIGMGPVIKTIKGKKDGINYSIRALPIGGFVQMAGEIYEDDDTKKIPKDKFMCNRPWWHRLIILCAGVFNNFLLALGILFAIALIWGAPSLKPKIEKLTENSAAYEAGVKDGDIIKEVNGHKTSSWDVAQLYLVLNNKDNKYNIEIENEKGKVEKTTFTSFKKIELSEGDTIKSISNKKNKKETTMYFIADGDAKIVIENDGEVKEQEIKVNDEFILKPGDKIKSLELDDEKKAYIYIKDKYDLKVQHTDGSVEELELYPKMVYDEDAEGIVRQIGVYIDNDIKKGFVPAIKYAFNRFTSLVQQMLLTLGNLFTGGVTIDMLSGPVGIYSVVGDTRQEGIQSVLMLIALLSINLGIMNILPIPALDGGHVLFLIIELITRKKVNEKVEGVATTIFFGLLLLLMAYVSVNDIIRIIFN